MAADKLRLAVEVLDGLAPTDSVAVADAVKLGSIESDAAGVGNVAEDPEPEGL